MSIRDKRFLAAINQIIHQEIQKGNLPSSKEFAYKFNQYLRTHDLSQPSYQYQAVRSGQTVSSNQHNQNMMEIHNDLSLLYDNIIDIYNRLASYFTSFTTGRDNIEYQINDVESKLKEMILLYNGVGYLNTVFDVFNDTTKVDVSTTSAEVDIKNHQAAIPSIKGSTIRIIPSASAVAQAMPDTPANVLYHTISGNPNDALVDQQDQTWQIVALSENQETVSYGYFINFANAQDMNQIDLDLHLIKSTHVQIDFTPDNLNWFKLPYYENGVDISTPYSFIFPSITCQAMRIVLTKNEPDMESSSLNYPETTAGKLYYEYVFGIKSLKMYHLEFPPSAILYSKPLQVKSNTPFTIDKVSLNVDEVLPNGTDIKYWIALPPENDGDDPDWKAISPVNRSHPAYDQIIDFNNITDDPPSQFIIDPSISIGEYEQSSLYANGIKFYKIGEIHNKKIIDGTERLFIGRNTWSKQYFTGAFDDNNTHIPSMNDWVSPLSNIVQSHTDMVDGKAGLVLSNETNTLNTSYQFKCGVFCNQKETLFSAIPASTEPIAIYLNGNLLYSGIPTTTSTINYLLKNGWNEIIVLLYTRQSGTANGTTLDLNFDPRNYGTNVYSSATPMQKVALFDLRYNVKSNDQTKYALQTSGEDTQVIINYAVPGLSYDFYFNYVDGDAKDTILFKAEFDRDPNISGLSPYLNSYHLQFS